MVAPLVLIVLLSTPGFAQPAKPSYTPNVAAMDAVLKSKPNDESAHYYRAVAFQTAGDYQKAKVDYQWVTTHAKNQVLVRYAAQALRNLSPSAATTRGGPAGALEGRALQWTQRPRVNLPAGSPPGGGKYAIMRQPVGQQQP